MKYLICGDVHWSETCSIVRRQGNKYTKRLENLISSVQWVETLALDNYVEEVVYLGDFFDKAIINAEELSALSSVKFTNCKHTIIVGNHEISTGDTTKSSAHYFKSLGWEVIDTPQVHTLEDDTKVAYIPYITEGKREAFEVYTGGEQVDIAFSHNDLAGVQMGMWLSKEGFTLDEINKCCKKYYFNGHLHNNCFVDKKILNVGILTGRDFGEDATTYNHYVYFYDTKWIEEYGDEWGPVGVENPFAFNFYKLDLVDCFKMDKYVDINKVARSLKENAVISIKCKQADKNKIDEVFKDKASEIRYIIEPEVIYIEEEKSKDDLTVDHYAEFRQFCIENMDNTDELKQELDIICGGSKCI